MSSISKEGATTRAATSRVPSAIVVDGVSKRFRIHKERIDSLKERLTSRRRSSHEEFWALRDVSVSVPKGSMYALVGHNGSGKSSLLRIMAGIHRPTTGAVKTTGRISALLELGAGFHPDLTGRENIYLNAAILGLSKKETDSLYGQIVEFSGLSEFIDTQVKYYSSGMYVRLGFSVAVHVDPEILLVDEVIAVGDEEFQRRCMDHLNKLRRKGVTIVLVTHGLSVVQSMCDEATWLDHGVIQAQGEANEVVNQYISRVNQAEIDRMTQEVAEGVEGASNFGSVVSLERVELLDSAGNVTPVATTFEPLVVRVHFRANEVVEWPRFAFTVESEGGVNLAVPGMRAPKEQMPSYVGEGYIDYAIDRLLLAPGEYSLKVAVRDVKAMTMLDRLDSPPATLRVQPGKEAVYGLVDLNGRWLPPVADEA